MSAEVVNTGPNSSESPELFPRHDRHGPYPAEFPDTPNGRPLRVALVYAVCYRYRIPIFRLLSSHPTLDVRVMVSSGVPGTKLSNAPESERSGLDVRILWTLGKKAMSTGRSAVIFCNPTLPFHLLKFKPDVILIQGSIVPNNILVWLYAVIFRKPIVWWSLGVVRGREFRGFAALNRRLTKWIEKKSTVFVGYSSVAIDYFLRQGYPRDRCFNLINVVNTNLVAQQMKEAEHRVPELRKRYRLDGQRVLLFVGGLTDTKGVDVLVRAYERLGQARENTKLIIVGDGPERQNIEQLVKELGLGDQVILTGAVYEGVSAYFQLADLVVLPGTGGLAISEAMVHGLPVISSVGDGVEVDLIDDGENGFHVPPLDEEALIDKMTISLSSNERLKKMGEHSLRIVREKANIDQYLNEMLAGIYHAYELKQRRSRRQSKAI